MKNNWICSCFFRFLQATITIWFLIMSCTKLSMYSASITSCIRISLRFYIQALAKRVLWPVHGLLCVVPRPFGGVGIKYLGGEKNRSNYPIFKSYFSPVSKKKQFWMARLKILWKKNKNWGFGIVLRYSQCVKAKWILSQPPVQWLPPPPPPPPPPGDLLPRRRR